MRLGVYLICVMLSRQDGDCDSDADMYRVLWLVGEIL
jgi:hypothetical protein